MRTADVTPTLTNKRPPQPLSSPLRPSRTGRVAWGSLRPTTDNSRPAVHVLVSTDRLPGVPLTPSVPPFPCPGRSQPEKTKKAAGVHERHSGCWRITDGQRRAVRVVQKGNSFPHKIKPARPELAVGRTIRPADPRGLRFTAVPVPQYCHTCTAPLLFL